MSLIFLFSSLLFSFYSLTYDTQTCTHARAEFVLLHFSSLLHLSPSPNTHIPPVGMGTEFAYMIKAYINTHTIRITDFDVTAQQRLV